MVEKNYHRALSKLFFLLIVFCIPFGTKKFVLPFFEQPPIPIEYRSLFIYALDILIVLFVVVHARKIHLPASPIPLIGFLISALVSIFFATNIGIAVVAFFRLLTFVCFCLIVAALFRENILNVWETCAALGFSGTVQAVVAILQFRVQGSVGLKILGEASLGPATRGVARASTEFGNFLRVYGTMPHANVLAAFLVFAFLALCWLFLRARGKLATFGSLAALLVVSSAILLTFSRSGEAIFVLAVIAVIGYGFFNKFFRKKTIILAVALLSFFATMIIGLGALPFARAGVSTTEPSVTYRVDYSSVALRLMTEHPFFGIGLGNQVLSAVNEGLYQEKGMLSSWEWQPVHNIFLLIAAEAGLVGLFCFLAFLAVSVFIPAVKKFIKNYFREEGFDSFIVLIAGISWLALGFVDHFFWDAESGGLIFWLTLGIMMGISPHSLKDKAQASGA